MTTSSPLNLPKLLAARYRAARARPYLAGALYAMTVVSSEAVLTMGVDRFWRCYACPAFVEATGIDELAGVWLHEVAHLLRDHHGRAGRLLERARADVEAGQRPQPLIDPMDDERERLRMNLAMDCEINDDLCEELTDEDGVSFPPDAIRPHLLHLKTVPLFEQYLDQLPVSAVHGRHAWLDCGSGAHDGYSAWELDAAGAHPLSPAQVAAIRYRVAAQIRRGRGRIPGGWKRWADDVGQPRQDWRRLLHAAIRNSLAQVSGAVDYTYRRPGRRTVALGGTVVMPSLRRPVPRIAIVIDTSGSVADAELGTALAETAGILRAAGTAANRISVYSCDAAVQTAQSICDTEQINLVGGGGTDLRRGTERALSATPRPDVLIIMTDGHTPWPEETSATRVIAGLVGPPPKLDEYGNWWPPRPPGWIETVRLDDPA